MNPVLTIPLDEIDRTDDTFSVNFKPDLKRLRASIQSVGLTQPVLLRKGAKGLQIVCGFRRIAVLAELGSLTVDARMSEEEEDLKLFLLALHDNLATRSWNVIEKAVALDKLVHRFRIDRLQVIHQYLPLFDLETNGKILETFLALARMEDELKAFVLNQGVSRSNIRRFATYPEEDRKALLSVLSPMRWGENSLTEVLTLFEEIAHREGMTIKQVAQSPQIQSILGQERLPAPQKAESLKKALWAIRYPQTHRLTQAFERASRALGLPPSIKLVSAPHFEEKRVGLQVSFRTIEEFQGVLDTLTRLVDEPAFRSLLEHFGDEG